MNAKVALISFGCAKNLVDSEVMLGLLKQAGYRFVSRPDRADIIILNTCGFIRPARREAEAGIRRALNLKKRHPPKRVVVAGCYVRRNRRELVRAHPEVDDWLDVSQFGEIVQALRGGRVRRPGRTFLYSHLSPRVISTPPGWSYLKISEGCSHRCSFCAIPMIKGAYRSRPPASILEEARRLGALGVREVDLVSQDTTSYGRDLGLRHGLTHLLRKLLTVPGLDWIRVLYGYPEEVDASLLEVLGESKVCPYLDLPFQHADRTILRRMGRGLDAPRALRLIERIRRAVPGIALRTSLIVGFPGEGRAEFDRLADFVRQAAFDHLGVFTYSPEEGTRAVRWPDSVSEAVKKRRRARLMSLQARISRAGNKKYRGRTLDVLLDALSSRDARLALGRTRYQAPEVDGRVEVRVPAGAPGLLHAVHRVEITDTGVYDLRGNLVG
jgi:ribosomal protein S12 methylthiotransferase